MYIVPDHEGGQGRGRGQVYPRGWLKKKVVVSSRGILDVASDGISPLVFVTILLQYCVCVLREDIQYLPNYAPFDHGTLYLTYTLR